MEFPKQGRIAGVDFGTVRIGIAISDPGQTISSPFENYTRQGEEADSQWFRQFAKEEDVAGFVVGLPIHTSGEESQKSVEARQFGQWLNDLTGKPVCFYDERYTSAQAETILGAAQLTKKRRKQRLDMLAAQIILASFLESDQRDSHQPMSLDDVP